MKRNIALPSSIGVLTLLSMLTISCNKQEIKLADKSTDLGSSPSVTTSAIANPRWSVTGKLFEQGAAGSFESVAVKDPSLVYDGGRWHVFYTGTDGNQWKMGYVNSPSLFDMKSEPRRFMNSLNGGGYFCAPQVFNFPAKGRWFLIYQSGLGATYSTNTSVSNYGGWAAGKGMGFNDGIDFWCIADNSYVYCFYSAQDGSKTIKRRRTTIANFPNGWESPTIVATDTFEAPHVYRNKADGKYYMMVEDIGRYFELWTASNLNGTWTKVSETWAAKSNLTERNGHWTDQVSHGEILRSGSNELMEINNIDRCEIFMQGVVNGSYSSYIRIPYDLGLMQNF
ncbi:non-reducing end alpha-L-arabinofuranosidase family hydrolase [Cytophagaceae bacterium YF14B1]|uniref:non-reducing end alpha-L-arabinofuranosidase n=1 Tax=Xanthocytophaga flava TaxID=3048013 RepID=A0AAE3QP23_9BACT|nr:non-reducing end alpha-L-arabinofuranosidase family hydrolase [Xanthocytophaga flavus]MDJ1482655.1 non-reducing end alpha-L-arabinofuranosidase family hydrolase [Xanthocytophaga flavus]